MDFESFLNEERKPMIVVNEQGIVDMVNESFTEAYGWNPRDLVGKTLTLIIPEGLRDAHQMGFARFLSTTEPTVQNMELELEILFADGSAANALHFITSGKVDGQLLFAATIERI